MNNQNKIIEVLKKEGVKLLNNKRRDIMFVYNGEDNPDLAFKLNSMYSNLEKYSFLFVLGCVMDRQIKTSRAWTIPYSVMEELNIKKFKDFLKFDKEAFIKIFEKKKLHRFNKIMAENFYNAIQLIHKKYNDDAYNIWRDRPKSATLVLRFLEFSGVGIKIATMATNILVRGYKIPVRDKICIDISPDVHVKKIFKRTGLVGENVSIEEIIYKARELNPLYPGIFDFPVFNIGVNYCKINNPLCHKCYLNKYCPKIKTNKAGKKNEK